MEMVKEPSIPQVLDGENILITGGTGFLGKVLIEKILRCCPGVHRVYLIVRSKRGDCIEKRIEELIRNTLFDRCRAERGDIQWCCRSSAKDFPRKNGRKGPIVVGIAGDIAEAGLGLSDEDRSELESQVSVVFHSAATVKFNSPLRQATFLNTRGTRDMLELAKKMSNLKVFVHVSTAFAHSSNNDGILKERFYSVPMDPDALIKATEELNDEEFQKVSESLAKVYINTYLCTKAMAERIIEKHNNHLPISIYRPGIIGGIHNDPIPGWVERTQSPYKIVYGCTSGLLGALFADPEVRLEFIPVDHVVNAMLAVTWEAIFDHTSRDVNHEVRIYNHVTNVRNPMTMEAFSTNMNEVFAMSKGNISYSQMKCTKNTAVYEIQHYLRLYCARMMDGLESTRGNKTITTDMVRRIYNAVNLILYFMNNDFVFSDARLIALRARCSIANRENENNSNAGCFNFDISNFYWDKYLRNMFEYMKTAIFGEKTSSVDHLFRVGQIFRLLDKFILLTGTALSFASVYLLSKSAHWLYSTYWETRGLHT